jgi:hypothetical protein
VTHTPLLFWPPVFGPLSRSEKKMRGGAICADMNVAQKSKERTETIFRNLSIATPIPILMASENGLSGFFMALE